jgi:hypothetical protein
MDREGLTMDVCPNNRVATHDVTFLAHRKYAASRYRFEVSTLLRFLKCLLG